MPFRRCGESGLKLPAIALGAWETFGGYRDAEVTRNCIFGAFNLGITHFDLANNYGRPPGQAETVVGRVLAEMPRAELIVSTKAGFWMWPGPYGQGSSRKSLLASIDQSLQRLGLDYVDIFYSHRHDPETPLEETLLALDQIVRSGKALYAGLSNYSGKLLEEAVGLTRQFRLTPILVEQSSYSLFNRKIEADLLPSIHHAGTGVIAFSPLAQGLLSEKYLEGFPDGSRATKTWTEEQRKRLTPALLGENSTVERNRQTAGTDITANGDSLDPAPARNHECADRRFEPGSDQGKRQGAGESEILAGRPSAD